MYERFIRAQYVEHVEHVEHGSSGRMTARSRARAFTNPNKRRRRTVFNRTYYVITRSRMTSQCATRVRERCRVPILFEYNCLAVVSLSLPPTLTFLHAVLQCHAHGDWRHVASWIAREGRERNGQSDRR